MKLIEREDLVAIGVHGIAQQNYLLERSDDDDDDDDGEDGDDEHADGDDGEKIIHIDRYTWGKGLSNKTTCLKGT